LDAVPERVGLPAADHAHLARRRVGEELERALEEPRVLERDALEHRPREVAARVREVDPDPGAARLRRGRQDAAAEVGDEERPARAPGGERGARLAEERGQRALAAAAARERLREPGDEAAAG